MLIRFTDRSVGAYFFGPPFIKHHQNRPRLVKDMTKTFWCFSVYVPTAVHLPLTGVAYDAPQTSSRLGWVCPLSIPPFLRRSRDSTVSATAPRAPPLCVPPVFLSTPTHFPHQIWSRLSVMVRCALFPSFVRPDNLVHFDYKIMSLVTSAVD